jgi:hypothetical protein
MHHPTDRHSVIAQAARIIETNGLWHGDYVPDVFNRRTSTPHHARPMSVVAALNCAVTGDPRTPSNLSWAALRTVARVVRVEGEPAWSESIEDQERHVDSWSDSHKAAYVIDMLLSISGQRASREVAA